MALGVLEGRTGLCGECLCNWGILGEIWGRAGGQGALGGYWDASLECGWVLGVLLEGWEGLAAKLGCAFHRMGR